VIRVMDDRVAKAGLVILAGARQQRRVREMRFDQALALERHPGGRVLQAGGVAREHDIGPEMEMVAMRLRQVVDHAGAGLVGRRAAALAEVRLAVLRQMLELAIARLAGRSFAGVPLIEQQLVIGALADVVTGAELASSLSDDAPAAARHEWLTEAGWTVTKFFGAEGYIADHPVRSLYVSTLVADVWIARAPESGR